MIKINESRHLYIGALILSGLFFAYQLSSLFFCLQERDRVRNTKDKEGVWAPAFAGVTASPGGIEGAVNNIAKKAQVSQLLSLVSGQANGTFEIEWEASQKASMDFIQLLQSDQQLGSCHLLQISSLENNPRLVRARATFGLQSLHASFAVPAIAEADKSIRNVFASLWPIAVASDQSDRLTYLKKEEEARRKDQEKTEAQRKIQEEQDQLTRKRQQLESNLILTGMVNNGRETLAFVNNRGANGATVMLRNGDIIEEARVTSMEPKKGELVLDYDGKFQVSLHLKSGLTGVVQ